MGKKKSESESVVLRVVSDERYVVGVPAVVGSEIEVDAHTAYAHMKTGLFEVVSGDPVEAPLPPPYTKSTASGDAVADADGAAGGDPA